MILCVECIVDSRINPANSEPIKHAATVVDGKALCANHMMPMVNAMIGLRPIEREGRRDG